MDVTNALIEEQPASAEAAGHPCPGCAEASGGTAVVTTSLFPDQPLRRCPSCGTRYSDVEEAPRTVVSCLDCGLPFLAEDSLPRQQHQCPDCRTGRIPADLPDVEVAEATEREVRAAVDGEWRFVSAPSLSVYLNRLAGQISRRLDPAPASSRVVLFEDPHCRTLALPSGTVLLSLGTLASLEDEAELAFVLAHELAHAASADAAVRLVRVGLHVVALENHGELEQSWSHAANDLIRLGYGRARERDADERAFRAVASLGYDTQSVVRYLRRLQTLVERGDPRVAELALAHPLPNDRLRQIERIIATRPALRTAPRVNREVFRRAAGQNVLSTGLERVEGLGASVDEPSEESVVAERRHRRVWLAVAVVMLAVLLSVLGWFFLQ
jgi:predicted Zn-dependent protease